MARLEGKVQNETRKLEKAVIADNAKCKSMESKLEGLKETFSNKLKVIIANMDHEIDDIRNVISIGDLEGVLMCWVFGGLDFLINWVTKIQKP